MKLHEYVLPALSRQFFKRDVFARTLTKRTLAIQTLAKRIISIRSFIGRTLDTRSFSTRSFIARIILTRDFFARTCSPAKVSLNWKLYAQTIVLCSALATTNALSARASTLTERDQATTLAQPEQVKSAYAGTLEASKRGEPNQLGLCPLTLSKVNADVTAMAASLSIHQKFHNSFGTAIDAVYTFPLSKTSHHNHLTLKIGKRIVEGVVGKDSQNNLKQIIENIGPDQDVEIDLTYQEPVQYNNETFSLKLPKFQLEDATDGASTDVTDGATDNATTNATNNSTASAMDNSTGNATDNSTANAADNSTGNATDNSTASATGESAVGKTTNDDLQSQSISINVDTGAPIKTMHSIDHKIKIDLKSAGRVHITLDNAYVQPDKEFTLVWTLAGKYISTGYMVHKDGNEGFFSVAVIPPTRKKKDSDILPPPLPSDPPILSDLKLKFYGLHVHDISPEDDVLLKWQSPLYITGRYKKPAKGKVLVTGTTGGATFKQFLMVSLPETEKQNSALETMWEQARKIRVLKLLIPGPAWACIKGSISSL